MNDIFIAARTQSVALTCHGHGSERRAKALDDGLEIRSITRSDKDRFEAAMTMAFSADPAARWAWPDHLQFIKIFLPLVTLFGGKSFDHGTAYVIGDFAGVVQWLPPGVQPDDGPISELFQQNMSDRTSWVGSKLHAGSHGEGFNVILQALPLHGNGKIVLRAYYPAKHEAEEVEKQTSVKKAAKTKDGNAGRHANE